MVFKHENTGVSEHRGRGKKKVTLKGKPGNDDKPSGFWVPYQTKPHLKPRARLTEQHDFDAFDEANEANRITLDNMGAMTFEKGFKWASTWPASAICAPTCQRQGTQRELQGQSSDPQL